MNLHLAELTGESCFAEQAAMMQLRKTINQPKPGVMSGSGILLPWITEANQ
jgi:hypothetical protein